MDNKEVAWYGNMYIFMCGELCGLMEVKLCSHL